MGLPVLFLLLSLAFSFPLISLALVVMSKGTSLSVEKPDILGRKWANAPFKKTIQHFALFLKLIREILLF